MTSSISFSGISSGIDTQSLISAILEQESAPLTRLQTKLETNTERSTLLSSISTKLSTLSASMNDLLSLSFENLKVESSDEQDTYVTATASSSATLGSYELQVGQIATAAKHTIGYSDLTSSIGAGEYAIKGVDGETHTFSLEDASDNLEGLRDAINGTDAGISATIIDTGKSGSSRYQLVLTAEDTGVGEDERDVFTLAQVSGSNSIGIATGTLDEEGALTSGGTDSATKAKNAIFWINGIEVERASNTVTDVVEGMTFQLKSGGQTVSSTPTTLTVETDVEGITEALQEVVDAFNAVWTIYSENAQYGTTTSSTSSTSTTSSDDNEDLPTSGALANDSSIRTMLNKVRSTLISYGSSTTADGYSSSAQFGLKTNQDGSISLDTSALEDALEENTSSVADVCYQMNSALQSLVTEVTSTGSGTIALIRQQIDTQNNYLTQRIETMETRLERRETILKAQYANMESLVSQWNSVSSSLSSLF